MLSTQKIISAPLEIASLKFAPELPPFLWPQWNPSILIRLAPISQAQARISIIPCIPPLFWVPHSSVQNPIFLIMFLWILQISTTVLIIYFTHYVSHNILLNTNKHSIQLNYKPPVFPNKLVGYFSILEKVNIANHVQLLYMN